MGWDLSIVRRVSSDFTWELVNCKEGGALVYRVIHELEPDRDRKSVIGDGAGLDPELKALLDRCAGCKPGAYPVEGVLDGVSYVLRCGGRVLALSCPEMSQDPSVAALGRCLHAFFERLGKA